MESGIDGHLVTRCSLSCTRLHRGKRPPVQDGVEQEQKRLHLFGYQRLQTRGCTGELRCGGRGRIHEEYGEFL